MKKALMIIGGIAVAGLLGIVALVGLVAVAMDTTDPTAASDDTVTATLDEEPTVKAEPKQAKPEPETKPPAAKPEPKPEPVEPIDEPLTASQDSAVRSAKSYLDSMPFSKSGLVEQLEFEGYPTADAQFAVNSLTSADVDWFEQAQKSAESYMESMPFSRSGMIEQLMFEGFTREQAEVGAAAVGLH